MIGCVVRELKKGKDGFVFIVIFWLYFDFFENCIKIECIAVPARVLT
jgi:hypothetical protein